MKSILRGSLFAILVMALSGGCRDTDPDVKSDGSVTKMDQGVQGDGVGPSNCEVSTVCKVKAGQVAQGKCVTFPDVVVTAVDANGSFTGDVWVQETSSGTTCGVKIYKPTRSDGKLVTDLSVGSHVKVQGYVTFWGPSGADFTDTVYTAKKRIKQLGPDSTGKVYSAITLLSTGTAPTPTVATVDQLAGVSTADTWEDMLVTSKTLAVAKIWPPDPKYSTVDITVVDSKGKTMELRDDLYPLSSLKELSCYDASGVLAYFYGYRIQPRQQGDLVQATGCIAPKAVKVSDVQDDKSASHPKEGDWLKVTGVITAVDANPYVDSSTSVKEYTGFWVQEESSATNGGVYVYYKWASNSKATAPVAGKKVELTGFYDDYYDLAELKDVRWEEKGTGTITATTVDASKVMSDKTHAELYEGMLVTVANVEVGAEAKTSKGTVVGIEDKTTKLQFQDMIYDFMTGTTKPKVGDKFMSITGVLHYAYSTWMVLPRSATDLVKN